MNNEMLAMLEYLESERGISRDSLVALIEEALVAAGHKSLGTGRDVTVKIDPKTGDIRALERRKVVETVTQPDLEITLADAQRRVPTAQLDEVIELEVKTASFGRIAAQAAKQAIQQRLRQAEKSRISEDYRDKLSTLLSGVVRRVEKGDVYVDFQRAEGVMRHGDRIPGEDYAPGDHFTALLVEVNADKPGPCLIVSRAHPDFVRVMFEREVSEMSEGLVTIKGVSREPGYRTKIAVDSDDPHVDPVGACVGMRGNRVKNIVRELAGEKVDIIRWSANIKEFVANALQPAKLSDVEVDEPAKTVRVTVPEDQLSLAIGKKGQNARLAAKLTGWRIDINRLEKPPEQRDFAEKVQHAIEALARIPGIGEEDAGKLVRSGFSTLEGIREAEPEDLAATEGIDPERARAIIEIARTQLGG
jgi:N utilization substance protein A